jgi:hypothetical protein
MRDVMAEERERRANDFISGLQSRVAQAENQAARAEAAREEAEEKLAASELGAVARSGFSGRELVEVVRLAADFRDKSAQPPRVLNEHARKHGFANRPPEWQRACDERHDAMQALLRYLSGLAGVEW